MHSCVALLCGPPLLGFQKHVWVVVRDMKTELGGGVSADVRGGRYADSGSGSRLGTLRSHQLRYMWPEGLCFWERRVVQMLCVEQESSTGTAHISHSPCSPCFLGRRIPILWTEVW